MTAKGQPGTWLCEPCLEEGHTTLADYLYRSEDESLQGPALGDPDFWPPQAWRSLCQDHFRRLPPDCCVDYVSVDDDNPVVL